ncbi:protein-glutamate O-methyltransferase CheR [Tissierella sp. Yu-01]|uniref:CheR family methyltransferase n=1 Tax=Tissierella sp. Yu-01 TaxID=3035694 RepID=UPI00240E80A5|nr:protein-glutamate O-methyltransferase CheR [Tissierella sp. Yu-01]WFA07935.1 protein-glutamate O-methyltransferase CheR [Tissierella sp. Yu-01]
MSLDFDFFYNWAYRNLNLNLDAYKETQLQRRIGTVMKNAGATDLQEYAKLISNDEKIKRDFLNYITINVTEFFRNKEIFEEFENVLKEILVPRFKTINIWSAACSIGAEPYSLAIIMDKNKIPIKNKILATDIDEPILQKARQGVYKENEIKNISKDNLKNYFTLNEKEYAVDEKIKNMVTFKKHDLILDNYEKGFNAIVCRNVTIYFKNETRDLIYRKFQESLVPGGIFFTGATESIYNPKEYGLKKLSTFIYEKI